MRAWVLIAIVCVGGTAAARDARRRAAEKSAASPPAAVAPSPAAAAPRSLRTLFCEQTGDCDTDRCWGIDSCGSRGRARSEPAPVPAGEVPTTPLTGTEVVDGFRAVERTVQGCRAANARRDPICVHAAITKDGRVSAATVKGQLTPPTTACVENAVKGAHFRASSGLAADYVFLFRRFESAGAQAPRDGGVDANRDAAGQ